MTDSKMELIRKCPLSNVLIYSFAACIFVSCFQGVLSIQVTLSSSTSPALLGNSYFLYCQYALPGTESLLGIDLYRKRSADADFVKIVTFQQPGSSYPATYADSTLASRTVAINPTNELQRATLEFNEVKCSDKAAYRWDALYNNGEYLTQPELTSIDVKGVQERKRTATHMKTNTLKGLYRGDPVRIHKEEGTTIHDATVHIVDRFKKSVTVYLSAGEVKEVAASSIYTATAKTSFNTDGSLTYATDVNYKEGDDITFTCHGDVGSLPTGWMTWYYYIRVAETNVTTHAIQNSPVPNISACKSTRTSTLTLRLEKEFNGFEVRCTVNQDALTAEGDGHIQTQHIAVQYAPRVNPISTLPKYEVGTSEVTLTCSGDGNPPPTYSWVLADNSEQDGPTLKLQNLQLDMTGVYTCVASNEINGQNYTANRTVNIAVDIDDCATITCDHGTCEDHVHSYKCSCEAGWTGDHCDEGYLTTDSPVPACANGVITITVDKVYPDILTTTLAVTVTDSSNTAVPGAVTNVASTAYASTFLLTWTSTSTVADGSYTYNVGITTSIGGTEASLATGASVTCGTSSAVQPSVLLLITMAWLGTSMLLTRM